MKDTTHPRPLLRREHWRDLCGTWRFAFDPAAAWHQPEDVVFDREIQVPYPPESIASGIHDTGFHPVVWYSTRVQLEPHERQGRLLLHFGAVDYRAKVWVNGRMAVEHRGGHIPFYADITELIGEDGSFEITVRAEDDPHDLAKPRGKQDWMLEPHEIWYPRTTGIWQPVWIEVVPETRIARLSWTPHLERWEFGLEIAVIGPLKPGLQVRVRMYDGERLLADDRYGVLQIETFRRIGLADPGIDDYRNDLLWSPEHPNLLDAVIELVDGDTVIDRVESYTAMRSVGIAANRFYLNGRPYFLRMVLDQGYWPESLMTATDDELRRDVELTKMLGFNGARKHQKIENPRWLYWCDRLGLLVWEEMPSPYRFTSRTVDRLVNEWVEVIKRDYSHPCIVAWVPFNESWGVPDLPSNPAHQDYVRALYHLTKTLDPSRPVIGNDGWEHVATDMIAVHDYTTDPREIYERYRTLEAAQFSLNRFLPGGRTITLPGFSVDEHPIVLSEFGGIAYAPREANTWGYSRATDEEALRNEYVALLEALNQCQGIAGFCYTQLTDTFQEANGLLYMDRRPKTDIEPIARATRGARHAREIDLDPNPDPYGYSKRWRQRSKA
ncbi:beta-galactosidase/beta-glucuronidase [Deinobacterium chartae]|uniref:Beta-galactosidase/beta-glucuronidase n=1 Tax=Deinobacterium chartae TaxID=521158 RepID=A0A841I0W0_9DEIO|nr:glycoside hydrolase family 2 TIM barrel-domain containing protein [Deinobacterium chartae]MBB6098614.1 beta-galactosidase/beta-glucuronidase [Deinobacterium chartae]